MLYYYIFLNHSVAIAAIVGAVRFKALGEPLRPFIYLMWLATINESLSLYLILTIKDNTINGNIYTLLEYFLLLLQFNYWLKGPKWLFITLVITGSVLWITDNLVLHTVHDNNSLFRAGYSIIVMFLCITKMNRLIIDSPQPVMKNGVFQICAALLFYSGCRAFMEIFNVFHVEFSASFGANLFWALATVNCLANFVYAIALICIPAKQQYLWPS